MCCLTSYATSVFVFYVITVYAVISTYSHFLIVNWDITVITGADDTDDIPEDLVVSIPRPWF